LVLITYVIKAFNELQAPQDYN